MAGYWDGNQFVFNRPGQAAQQTPLQFIGSPTVSSVSAPTSTPSPQPSLSGNVQSGGEMEGAATGDENGDLSGFDVNYGALGDVAGTLAFGPVGGLFGRGLGTLADYSQAESMMSGADLSIPSAFFDGLLGPLGAPFGTESFQEQINALDPLTKDPKLALEMGLLDNVAPETGLLDAVDFSKGFSSTSDVAQQAQADAFARGNESYGPDMPGNGGTSAGGGLCFITTAVCKADGKPDDCDELETLRWFRDNVLLKHPLGPDLVKLYYRMAPEIVRKIDATDKSDAVYQLLRDRFILPAVKAVNEGDNQRAFNIYAAMVRYCL
jgi:hypothetical protein